MKILIITAGFFPGKKYGGPPVSVDNFCTLMSSKQGNECFVVTSNHDLGETEAYTSVHKGWNDRGNCKVLYLSSNEFGYKKFREIIRELKPDLLYLQSLFSSYIIPSLLIAKQLNVNVLLSPRGEICKGAFNKKYKKVPYIFALRLLGLLNNVQCQSTSDDESEMIEKVLRVSKDRINKITNIPSIPKKEYKPSSKEVGKLKLIFLSRIVEKKNLKFSIEALPHIKGEVDLDVYGPLEDKNYWKECEKAISVLPPNINVNYCGLISHDDVHDTFSRYHGFLFPTFSENYGQVIAESLLVGCPVIISDQTPWNDVNEHHGGWAIPLSCAEKFKGAIQTLVDMNQEQFNKISTDAKQYVSQKTKLDEIVASYKKIMNVH